MLIATGWLSVRVVAIVCLVGGAAGCGGVSRRAFPVFAEGLDTKAAADAVARTAPDVRDGGLIRFVGIRVCDSEFVVIDVFAALSVHTPEPAPEPSRIYRTLFNRFQVFEAGDGLCFRIQRASGEPVAILPIDQSEPVGAARRARYNLRPDFEYPVHTITTKGEPFTSMVFPVMVRCASPIKVGESISLRYEGDDGYSRAKMDQSVRVLVAKPY